MTYKDFTFNVWGNVPTTNYNDTEWELSEIDLTLDYTRRVCAGRVPVDLSVGSTAFLFPTLDIPDLLEFYAGASLDVPLHPSLFVYREVLDQEYTYATFDLAHSFAFCWASLDLGAGIGYGDQAWHRALYGISREALHEVHAKAALSIPRGQWTISPMVWWSSQLSGEVRDAAVNSDLFVWALTISYAF